MSAGPLTQTPETKGQCQLNYSSAAFRFEVPETNLRHHCRNFKSAALASSRSQLLQFRKILFAEFLAAERIAAIVFVLQAAQLHAADFAGNRLRQFGHELDPPDALEWRQPRVQVAKDRQR